MKGLTAVSFVWSLVIATLTISPVSAQNDNEVPELFDGVWYRIALDGQGNFIHGDGHGYAGGTWYYYPQPDGSGIWRQWFYNGTCDPNRKGYLDYAVYIKAVDRAEATYAQVRFNWATPEWSALGKRRPPLPCDVPTAELEDAYMDDKLLHCVDNLVIGTVEPIKTHTIRDYNPEWTSIDIRGINAYVYRGAYHYCLLKDPNMGACYDLKSGDCYTAYEDQCVPPYMWLGAGTSCSDYLAPDLFPIPVYRFWAPRRKTHFYTADEREKDMLLSTYSNVWAFEGIAYSGHVDDTDPDCLPVHRFWSETLGVHFYTISESEAARLEADYSDVWAREGIAFYAYPEGRAPAEAKPVYRFWSDVLGCHFYTAKESERDKLIKDYPLVWTYEGIAWFAYLP